MPHSLVRKVTCFYSRGPFYFYRGGRPLICILNSCALRLSYVYQFRTNRVYHLSQKLSFLRIVAITVEDFFLEQGTFGLGVKHVLLDSFFEELKRVNHFF